MASGCVPWIRRVDFAWPSLKFADSFILWNCGTAVTLLYRSGGRLKSVLGTVSKRLSSVPAGTYLSPQAHLAALRPLSFLHVLIPPHYSYPPFFQCQISQGWYQKVIHMQVDALIEPSRVTLSKDSSFEYTHIYLWYQSGTIDMLEFFSSPSSSSSGPHMWLMWY